MPSDRKCSRHVSSRGWRGSAPPQAPDAAEAGCRDQARLGQGMDAAVAQQGDLEAAGEQAGDRRVEHVEPARVGCRTPAGSCGARRATKQGRARRRPRTVTRAVGCRWPAISERSGASAGRWRKVVPATCHSVALRPPRPAGGRGSWLPTSQIQSCRATRAARRARSSAGRRRLGVAVVKAVAEADHGARRRSARAPSRGRRASRACRRAAAGCRAARPTSPSRDAGRPRPAAPARASTAHPTDRPARWRRHSASRPASCCGDLLMSPGGIRTRPRRRKSRAGRLGDEVAAPPPRAAPRRPRPARSPCRCRSGSARRAARPGRDAGARSCPGR